MKIVVVEDEHNTREGLVRLIGRLDARYEVVGEADNGADGLAVIESAKPDLIITDIKMPGMSGLDMLNRLRNSGWKMKVIILTGYSEFEYAQKAIKMSASDYLEKPITVPDLKDALAKVELELLEQEKQSAALRDESPESMIRRLFDLTGDDAVTQEKRIRERTGFSENKPIQLALFGFDGPASIQLAPIGAQIKSLLGKDFVCSYFGTAVPGTAAILLQPKGENQMVPDYINHRVIPELHRMHPEFVCCFDEAVELPQLKRHVDDLNRLAKWSLFFGNQRVICRKDMEQGQAGLRELPYPMSLESKCSRAVVSADGPEIAKQFKLWLAEFACGNLYGPELTLEYSSRFVANMLNLARDLHGFSLSDPLRSDWPRQLREVRSIKGYTRIMDELSFCLAEIGRETETPVYSLLIQKAVRIIQMRYAEGVTLEEIADSLRVTPAYLSGQFNREVGMPFSSYFKELRLKKAKEFLLGSELKAYEIAQKVGYPDPKYFSRVFKEATGMSPGEYQKFNAR